MNKESKLEIEAEKFKKPLLKRIEEYTFKLTGYLMDGIPISKDIKRNNGIVYGRFNQ